MMPDKDTMLLDVTQASAGFAASIALNPRASNSHASLGKLQLQMGEVSHRRSNRHPTAERHHAG